jgi:hypothetical protein
VCKKNYESSDRLLNYTYKVLASKLSGEDRKTLLNAQRAWIMYKEKFCQAAYDFTSPGEEAGIEKLTCLDGLTRTREKELKYIDSASGMDDFFHAADVVSQFYEAGDRGRFIDKLANDPSVNDDKNWNSYVMDNCKLAAARLHEEKKDCVARQTFHRY